MAMKNKDDHHNHHHHHQDGCCSQPSTVRQTLDEMAFERGIWTAVLDNDEQRVHRLIQTGDVNTRDNAGYTGLHYAARKGNLAMCRLLLDHGANIQCKTTAGQATALHRAAMAGHRDVCQLLVERGADPMDQDADGRCAAHRAAENGHRGIVDDQVAAQNAIRKLVDHQGSTPVQLYEDKYGPM